MLPPVYRKSKGFANSPTKSMKGRSPTQIKKAQRKGMSKVSSCNIINGSYVDSGLGIALRFYGSNIFENATHIYIIKHPNGVTQYLVLGTW